MRIGSPGKPPKLEEILVEGEIVIRRGNGDLNGHLASRCNCGWPQLQLGVVSMWLESVRERMSVLAACCHCFPGYLAIWYLISIPTSSLAGWAFG